MAIVNFNEPYDFSEKTVLITGASSELGEQFARTFCEVGARVILAARNITRLKMLSLEIPNSIPIRLDVSDENSVKDCLTQLESNGERIDICVNNASITGLTPIFTETEEEDDDDEGEFESIMNTNLLGVWYVIKNVAKHMRKYDIHGSIINISSVNTDEVPEIGGYAYSISKGSVIHLTVKLALELSHYRIRINCIAPGAVKKPNLRVNSDTVMSCTRSKIVEDPCDISKLILSLSLHDSSHFFKGACFTIDDNGAFFDVNYPQDNKTRN